MSRSFRKPFDSVVCFSSKNEKSWRTMSRRLIRRKSKQNVKELITNPDAPYVGTSFKDGYDEWIFPSEGIKKYAKAVGEVPPFPWLSEEKWEKYRLYRNSIMRK